MNCALLVVTLLSADADTEVVVAAPEPAADEWIGEARRVHYGLGAKVHWGLMQSQGAPYLYLQSELAAFLNIRVFGHHEWRVGIGIAAGWPDTFAGESNVSFRFNLSPRFSVGVGLNTFLSLWSIRGGLEVPLAFRFGPTRRHEISLTLRGTAGVFNGSTFAWWNFRSQRLMWGGDAVLGYSAIF